MKNKEQIRIAIHGNSPTELAIGFLRFEALRQLNPRQFAELHARNQRGENFDSMVDELCKPACVVAW